MDKEKMTLNSFRIEEIEKRNDDLTSRLKTVEKNVNFAKIVLIIFPVIIAILLGYEYTQIPSKVQDIIDEKIGVETLQRIENATRQIEENRKQSEEIKESLFNTLTEVKREKDNLENDFTRIESKVDDLLSSPNKKEKIKEVLDVWQD